MFNSVSDTLVVDTHTVYDGLVLYDAEESRLGVSGLRLGSQGADFNETEAEIGQFVVMFSVLVKPPGQSDRIPESDAENFPFQ